MHGTGLILGYGYYMKARSLGWLIRQSEPPGLSFIIPYPKTDGKGRNVAIGSFESSYLPLKDLKKSPGEVTRVHFEQCWYNKNGYRPLLISLLSNNCWNKTCHLKTYNTSHVPSVRARRWKDAGHRQNICSLVDCKFINYLARFRDCYFVNNCEPAAGVLTKVERSGPTM
jgi:hypothetical protein